MCVDGIFVYNSSNKDANRVNYVINAKKQY